MAKRVNEYIYKAQWRATSVKLKVQAVSEKQAFQRVWGIISRMQGADGCESVELMEVR